MPAAMRDEMTDRITAGQRQVAHQIKRFVSNAFVIESCFILDRTVVVEDQQIARRCPLGQSLRSQPLSFLLENKRALQGLEVSSRWGVWFPWV